MSEQQVVVGSEDVGGKSQEILYNCTVIFIYLVFPLKVIPYFCASTECGQIAVCSLYQIATHIVPQASLWGVLECSRVSWNQLVGALQPSSPTNHLTEDGIKTQRGEAEQTPRHSKIVNSLQFLFLSWCESEIMLKTRISLELRQGEDFQPCRLWFSFLHSILSCLASWQSAEVIACPTNQHTLSTMGWCCLSLSPCELEICLQALAGTLTLLPDVTSFSECSS